MICFIFLMVLSEVCVHAASNTTNYSITYNLNGGSGSFSTQSVSYGSTFKINNSKPTMSGETFKCWYLRRNKDSKYYVGGSNGWLNWDDMGKKNLEPASYSPGQSLTLGESWIKDGGEGSTFSFVARWTPVGTRTIADGKYYITTKLSGNSCISVQNESTSDGANVQISSSVGNEKQLWIVKYLDDGYYSIQNANSGKTLDVDNGGIYSGTNVQQWAGISDNQKWVISKNSDGTYCIRAKCNGLYLDLDSAKTADGTNIQVWVKDTGDNQKWEFKEYTLLCNHESTEIRNARTATCTEAGYTGDTYCSRCKVKLNSGYIIPALEHSWSKSYEVDKEATSTQEGVKSIHCIKCGSVKPNSEAVIPRINTSDNTTTLESIGKKCVSVKSKVDYTGSALKPSVIVKCKGKTLKLNRDYKLSYSNNKYPGTGKVTVKGIGNYKGTVTATFKIQPKSFKITSVKRGRKGFTVCWKKATGVERKGITGFQIRYTKKSNLKSGWKTSTGKKNTYWKLTLKNAKAKTKYYVELRSYVTVKIGNKKKTFYSPWSKPVRVVTK